MTHTYNISGMTCGNCVAKVKSELLKLGEVASAEVQLQSPQATIFMQTNVSLLKLQEAVSKTGNYIITEADTTSKNEHTVKADKTTNSYLPIFLIFGYIAGTSVIGQMSHGSWSWMNFMPRFMAGFFLVFSFFKLINLKGFADGYSTYDVIAKKFNGYGFVYPFIELLLGIAFLTGFNPFITNGVTLIVMSVSVVGVIQSLLMKRTVQCACLGTVIKLPLGKVTLFEDLLMIVMSACALLGMLI